MIIPSVFFGKHVGVGARTAEIIDRLSAGKTFAEALPDVRPESRLDEVPFWAMSIAPGPDDSRAPGYGRQPGQFMV